MGGLETPLSMENVPAGEVETNATIVTGLSREQ